jgi:hypothetical protein
MGKFKDMGMAKPDDPLFTGGYEFFSRPEPTKPPAVDPAPAPARGSAAGKAVRRRRRVGPVAPG